MEAVGNIREESPFKAAEAAGLLIIVGAVLYIYRGAFSGFFVQDDFGWLGDSRFHSIGEYLRCFFRFNPARAYRPLSQETFFWAGQALFGMRPAGFHVMSIAIHLLGTVALYFLLRQFSQAIPSAAGTLFYGKHNAHTRSVYWISAVPEPMAAAFYLISLLCFIRFDRTGRRQSYAFSMAAAVLGMMSKESILSLPAIIMVYCLIFSRRRLQWAAGYFVLPAAYLALRLATAAGASPYPLTFGRDAAANLFAYMAWAAGISEGLLKLKLHWQPEGSYPWIAASFVFALAILIVLSRNYKVGIFSIVWFFLALQPVLYFSQHIYAYYLAPALPAIALLIASALSAIMSLRAPLGLAAAVGLVWFSGWTAEGSVKREGKWWNERSFIPREILRQMPEAARQVPPGRIAFMFGFGPEEFGAMQEDAAFKAFGFPPTRFILVGLDQRTVNDIEKLKQFGGLDGYYCFVYSGGTLTNRTVEFRRNPNAFYSGSPAEFLSRPEVRIEANAPNLMAGKDTLVFRVVNMNAPAIDVLYELNGFQMPPILHWRLDRDHAASVFLDASTPKGSYHWIGIRESLGNQGNRWIAVDFRMTVQ
jgi:hypothetical protein